jgi:uncharacterized protein YrrD
MAGDAAGATAPVVETQAGRVRGAVVDGVLAFKGGPMAPPLVARRASCRLRRR